MRLTAMILTIILSCLTLASANSDSTIKSNILTSTTETMEDYFFFQPGVMTIQRNFDSYYKTNQTHLNGGGSYAHDFIVNGLSFRNPLTGDMMATFTPQLFKSIDIYDSYLPVSYGNATSGIITLETPNPGEKYRTEFQLLSDNFVGNSFDQNQYRGILSGKILSKDVITYWGAFERRYLGDRAPSSFTDNILEGSPNILPHNSHDGWTYHGKILFNLGESTGLRATFDGANDEWQQYRHYYNNPYFNDQLEHTPRFKDENYGLNTVLEHSFSNETSAKFSVGYFKSERIMGDGILFDGLAGYHRTYPNPEFDVYSLFKEGDTTTDGYYVSYYDHYLHHISSYMQYGASLEKELIEYNVINIGGQYKKYTLRYYNNTYPSNPSSLPDYNPFYVTHFGFNNGGEVSDSEDWKHSTKHPTELSIYISDHHKAEYFTFDFGLRLDRYDYQTKQLRNLQSPFSPDSLNVPYSDGTLDEADMSDTEPFSKISYRFGFKVHPADRYELHFVLQNAYQAMPYTNVYNDWVHFESRVSAGYFTVFGNSNIESQSSRLIDIGLKLNLDEQTTLRISKKFMKYSDGLSYGEVSPAFPFTFNIPFNNAEIDYNPLLFGVEYSSEHLQLFTNVIYGNAKSVLTFYESSRSILWKNSSSNPAEKYPTDYSKELLLSAGCLYETNFGLNITAIAKRESGYPYIPMMVYDAVTSRSVDQNPTGEINSANSDAVWRIDLKLEKEFEYKGVSITPFILVKNLLDEEIITGVYEGSGSPTSTGFLETDAGQQNIWYNDPDYEPRYRFLEQNPRNFAAPRQIFLGLKASF